MYPICKSERRGAATVEMAIVASAMFLFFFSIFEFGRGMLAIQSLEDAARAGCRVAILDGSTVAEIETEVDRVLRPAGIVDRVVIVEPTPHNSLEKWELVQIRVVASFNDMSWLPIPRYLGNLQYEASCHLPRESHPSS